MMRFISLVKTTCEKFFVDFVQSRLLAEYPDAVELRQHQTDRQSRNQETGSGHPLVGVL